MSGECEPPADESQTPIYRYRPLKEHTDMSLWGVYVHVKPDKIKDILVKT